MGNFLHTLGRKSFTHKWWIVTIWVVILAGLGAGAAYYIKPTSSAISIPGTEAQKTLDRFGELFPDGGKGSGKIVFVASDGRKIQEYQSQIAQLTMDISKISGVTAVISPFDNPSALSKDNSVAYAQVQLEGEAGAVSKTTIDKIAKLTTQAKTDGLAVESSGDLIDKVPGEILGVGEIAGVVLALLVLLMTLGSLVAAGMPVLVALVAVGTSMAGLFALSQVISINSTTPVLAVMLGLAVGIDYSLFIVSKYRGYLLEGYSYIDAAGKSIATAGNAVLFAAATVVIALSALTIVDVPFMSTMGLAGAATIAVAAIVAITLIPALLGIAGSRIFRGKTKRAIETAQAAGPHETNSVSHTTIWHRWGSAITRHPIVILFVALIVIVTVALPIRDLRLGLPTDEFAAADSTQHKAYQAITKGFGQGYNGPLLIVAEGLPVTSEADKAAVRAPIMAQFNAQVAKATAEQQAKLQTEAAQLTTPAQRMAFQEQVAAAQKLGEAQKQQGLAEVEKQVEKYAPLYQLKQVADRVAKLDNVKEALPAQTTDGGTKGIIQVIPDSAPADQRTIDLISYLRDSEHQKQLGGNAVTFGVTGATALQLDINSKLSAALPEYLAVVVGLSLILLVIAFRSILIPIKATLGFLLSVAAMFGAMVAVFQWGWFGIAEAPGPIVSFIPIIAIGILFGLAMDYEFFLVSSMQEAHHHTKDAKLAVVRGFALGSKVVTAAGVIMVAVFAGFITNHDATIQTIGFGLALGILVDAFIVRMTIVPAVMTLLGSSAWWLPKWLDRILPHVSIEGEAPQPAKK